MKSWTRFLTVTSLSANKPWNQDNVRYTYAKEISFKFELRFLLQISGCLISLSDSVTRTVTNTARVFDDVISADFENGGFVLKFPVTPHRGEIWKLNNHWPFWPVIRRPFFSFPPRKRKGTWSQVMAILDLCWVKLGQGYLSWLS